MNKSILSIAIILSLGTLGCANASTQYASTVPVSKARSAQYAAGGLDALWEPTPASVSAPEQILTTESRQSDLWNGSSVAGGWESTSPKADPKATFNTTITKLKF